MGSQYKCLVCGNLSSDKNYAISRHVKKHGMTFREYIIKYYKLISGSFETCGFCDRLASPSLIVNHIEMTYILEYKSGYSCETYECKNKICLDMLGEEYNSKKFEKIGSRSEYLSKKYKIDIDVAKKMKFKENRTNYFDNSKESFIEKYGEEEGVKKYEKRINGITKNNPKNKFPCTLENFIRRYGEEEGSKKYRDRCERISYTSSKDFFIEKYGEEEGNKVWSNKFKRIKISKSSNILDVILDNLSIKYQKEKNISSKFVDYFLCDFNIVIEYFGDYWHCNPKVYNSDFYTRQLKMTAKEIWQKDKIRLDLIKQSVSSIIVIWESSNIDVTLLEKVISDMKDKKTIIYI